MKKYFSIVISTLALLSGIDPPENLNAVGGDRQILISWDAVEIPDIIAMREDVLLWISDATNDYIELSITTTEEISDFSFAILPDLQLEVVFGNAWGGLAATIDFVISVFPSGQVFGWGSDPIPEHFAGVLCYISWDVANTQGFIDLEPGLFWNYSYILSSEIGEPFYYSGADLYYNIYREGEFFQWGVTELFYLDDDLGYNETRCYTVTAATPDEESLPSGMICATTDHLYDCNDPFAMNYNHEATEDDGNCEYYPTGDLNQDIILDVLDIVMMVDIVLGETTQ
ncbi:MAG: hypothetical protein HQ510_05965 [Candidatus Marinimicrobia bacterium]|nr:hypothetical protein [Candidatus Neomarinimicrobiota bacterium]